MMVALESRRGVYIFYPLFHQLAQVRKHHVCGDTEDSNRHRRVLVWLERC